MKLMWKQVLVAFVLGAVVGIAGSHACLWNRHHGDHKNFQERLLKRFNERLHLSLYQQQKVAAVLEQKKSKIDAMRAEVRPKFEEIRNATSAEIRQMLMPEQQKEFDRMNAEFEERIKNHREHLGGD